MMSNLKGLPVISSPRERFAALLAGTRVYAITDDCLEREQLLRVVDALLDAGIRLFQFRDKRRSDGERVELTRLLVGRVHGSEGLLIVNDRADIAIAGGADGVHLGQEDLPPAQGRWLVGAHRIVGASASYLEEVAPAVAAGVDYLGFGAVFRTETKPDAEYAGLDLLERACHLSPMPVVAIGGITAERTAVVLARGAAGVAVVSALFRAPDPGEAALRLLAAAGAGGLH